MIRGLAVLLVATVLSGAASREDLVFTPTVGAASTKTFQQRFEVLLVREEQVFTVDGEEREDPDPDGSGLVLKEHESLTITDEVLAVEGGRVTRLSRTFDELYTQSFLDAGVFEPETEPERGRSPLEGKTVLFTRDRGTDSFAVEFVADEPPAVPDSPQPAQPPQPAPVPQILQGLEASSDLAWFLPGRPVAVGESWLLEPAAFTRLAAPIGDHKIERPGDEREEDEFAARFDANLTGQVRCTLRDVAGDVAAIAIEMKLDTSVDESTTDGGLSSESSAYTFHFELAGELTWNIALGRAADLRLKGDARMKLVNDQAGILGGLDFDLHSVQEFEGTLEFEARVH